MNEANTIQAAALIDWSLIWSIIGVGSGIVVTMCGATWFLGRLLGGLQQQAKGTREAAQGAQKAVEQLQASSERQFGETRNWVEGLVTTLHNQHNELDRRVTRVETKIEHVPGSGTRYEQAHKGA